MGGKRRFAALRRHGLKLYRVNQGKALKVLGTPVHAGEFDSEQSGVCAALTCVWLQTMMNTPLRPLALQEYDATLNDPSLFFGKPYHRDMARYLSDRDVVTLQERYRASAITDADSNKRNQVELDFWRAAFSSSGLLLAAAYYGNVYTALLSARRGGPPRPDPYFNDQMEWLISRVRVDKRAFEPGRERIGVYIGLDVERRQTAHGEKGGTVGHAIAVFRLGREAGSPL
jgi:hypothetical protein